MKSVRDHLMFILPLTAILLGVEFFLAFTRVTADYEERLRANYSILVVARKPLSLEEFRRLDPHIAAVRPIPKKRIATEIARGMRSAGAKEVLAALPTFYNVVLDRFLAKKAVEQIRTRLLQDRRIKRVETFGESRRSQYNLFLLLKTIFWSFIVLLGTVSIFLVLKQMEVWQLAHRERMRIMEIFGAPMLLRSGVLFRMGIVDALVSTLIAAGIFASARYLWAPKSGIEILVDRAALLFEPRDLGVLVGIALVIVIGAVLIVALRNREEIE
ncbi:cell division protein FtsX [Nitratifractor sp.]